MMTGRIICTIVGLALTLSGCAIKRSEIVSPYQKALGAYYRALETRAATDLEVADQEASAVLERNPADHTARILRVNISLTRLRLDSSDNSRPIRQRLLNDLVSVSAGVDTFGDAADWVPARALVVMGDLLIIVGDTTVASALAGGSADGQKVAEAKSLFDAARQYYGGATALVDQKKTDATPGLVREAGNARQGHAVALRGALNAIDLLDPKLAFPMAVAVRTDLLRAWEAQSTNGAVPAASAGVLSLDAAQHAALRALYVTLGNDAQRQLSAWCGANKTVLQKAAAALTAADNKTVEEGLAILRRVLSMSEFEAMHASLATLLAGSGDNTASNDKVVFWLKRDLKQSCEPGS